MATRVRKRKLFWRIFSSYLVISVFLLIMVIWYSSTTLRSYNFKQARQELESITLLTCDLLRELPGKHENELADACHSFKHSTGARLTLIAEDGQVLADSDSSPARMENHLGRPEVQQALKTGLGVQVRTSSTLQKRMLYVARPLQDGEQRMIVRASQHLIQVDEAVMGLVLKIALAWLLASLLAGLLFFRISQIISRPFENLKSHALRLARGDGNVEFPEFNLDEAGGLSEAMRHMVNRLSERTHTISQQQEELEAILSSMSEALIAVDGELRILKLNKTMAALFGMDSEQSRGKHLAEIIRSADFNCFVENAMESSDMKVGELTFYTPEPRYLRCSGTRLRDTEGSIIGVVVVLNDITRLKRLEDLRRDFVANVSHELRTPITSIKGFVETLQGGALEDPKAARRFLDIISRQSDRLGNIIEDLLSLSKIEQSQNRLHLELEQHNLYELLDGAIKLCEPKARGKEIELYLDCDRDLAAMLHASLFEQAIVNLVDNAIKYSENQKTVLVQVTMESDHFRIEVKDEGFGIPRSHLSRLFERFYRVDKARSRDVGGTGLGLSIVKHIAQAHGGNVEVESQVGQGSTFTITIPRHAKKTLPNREEVEAAFLDA